MGKDEPVDGGRVAAKILNCMPDSKKKRLLESIKESSPKAFQRIEENVFSFDDIPSVTARGLQKLVKEISHNDLVLSLKTASQSVREALLQNMSDRKRQIVVEDLESLGPKLKSEVEEAQKRIIQKLDELRAEGSIQTASTEDIWV